MELITERASKKIYRDKDMIIKIFDEGYSKADILNEALNQSRVEETGINMPKIIEITMIDGKWAIVSEFIEGKTLKQLMSENPDKIDEYLEKFVDLQISVHEKKAPLLNKLKDKMNYKIASANLDATIRYELHTRLEAMPKHNKVCHGDFNPENIIITNDGTPYILDWSHATQGNASADVARTYLMFSLHENKQFADKYLNMFCKKTDTAKQYIQKWLPIVAASQSVKEKAEERDLLLKWVNVVEYE